MIHNLAKRAHDRNWDLDPVVRSLLDTDWYKLAMLQFIWRHFAGTRVRFTLINRTKAVRLAEAVDEAELRRQLDHVRGLRFTKSELIWLAGNTFYGQRNIFDAAFLEWLAGFSLPPYRLSREDGQLRLDFEGPWEQVTLWEIPALAIVSELRTRRGYARLGEMDLDILFARAKARLWSKVERLAGVPGLKFADFGTRRRHSFLWHEYVVEVLAAKLPDAFSGTSNTYLAYKHNLEAIGTNAHELPMVLAALARLGRLGRDRPQRVAVRGAAPLAGDVRRSHAGDAARHLRLDPVLPRRAGLGRGLDGRAARQQGPLRRRRGGAGLLRRAWPRPAAEAPDPVGRPRRGPMLGLHAAFGGRIQPGSAPADFRDARDFQDPAKWRHEPRCRISSGIGTKLTNDVAGCAPVAVPEFAPISLVCKVAEVEGRPAVKLSDNPAKATGPAEEVAHYRSVFGAEGSAELPVTV